MNNTAGHINKYLPAAVIYFFLNGMLLPFGMLYTTLMTPLLLIWVARFRHVKYLLIYFLLLIPFVVAQWIDGIENQTFYLYSLTLSFTVFVFCIAFYQYLSFCRSLRAIYKQLLLINACMVLVALVMLFIPSMKDVFWYSVPLSPGIPTIERLRMLTYEPSYYSTLFAPIAIYYLLKGFRKELPHPVIYFALVLIPLFLSLSFGVILGITLSFLVLLVLQGRRFIGRSRNMKFVLAGACLLAAVLVFLLVFFPDNVFFRRLENILAGNDTSFNGRTLDSFILSIGIASKRSLIWGAGFGQVKVLGLGLYRQFYHNYLFTSHEVVIPNSIGDILGTLGLLGVGIKLLLECYFFVKTRVFSNYYRLTLFIFIFVYQFTGSFISNIAEYVIWILAFRPDLFPEFNKPSVSVPSPAGDVSERSLKPAP